MNRKVYSGSNYSFQRSTKSLGAGGNGAVYDVITNPEAEYPVVAKFFECDKSNREERYKRFRREIEKVNQLKEVKGILPIIDFCCPDDCPVENDAAWYLMPKAEPFRVGRNRKIEDKIKEMLCLAKTIQELHSREMSHRDIKPENILIFNGEVILSDFGLVWSIDDERITEKTERIGPYRILPPEMEEVSLDKNLDFKPADVYLFAKVLWMYIKEDNIGFRGQYNRKDDPIYLDKHKLKVVTLEPIHRLLEQATEEYPENRITIVECIENLELQQQIVMEKNKDAPYITSLVFEETSKRALQKISPDVSLYEDKEQILSVLRTILPYSFVAIKDRTDRRRIVRGTRFNIEKVSENTWKLIAYVDRSISQQFYFDIESMTHRVNDAEIVLNLKPMKGDEMGSNIMRTIGQESIINPTNCIVIGRFDM